MASRTYDRDVPDGSTLDSAQLDESINEKGKDFDERAVQGGHKMATLTHSNAAEEHDGKHCIGIEDQTDHNDDGYLTLCWDFAGTSPRIRTFGSGHTNSGRTDFPGNILIPAANVLMGKSRGSWTMAKGVYFRHAGAGGGDLGLTAPFNNLMGTIFKVYGASGAPSYTVKEARMVWGLGYQPNIAPAFELRFRDASAGQCAVGVDPANPANSTVIATVTISVGDYSATVTGLSQVLDADDELLVRYLSGSQMTGSGAVSMIVFME